MEGSSGKNLTNVHGGRVGNPSRTWIVQPPRPDSKLRSVADASRAIASARTLEDLLAAVTEAAQAVIGTHQAITSRLVDGWSDARSYLILSEKYAEFRTFDQPPKGLGVLEYVIRENRPLRLDGEELGRHPDWRGLRDAPGHPPLPDYLAAPLVARDGRNIGLVQLSDKIDGTPFTEDDEAVLVQLALTASAVIEHVELGEQLEERVRHARLAADIGMAFTSEAPLEEKLQACVDAVVAHLDVGTAGVWIADEGAGSLELVATAEVADLAGGSGRVPMGDPRVRGIWEQRAAEIPSVAAGAFADDGDAAAGRGEANVFAGYPLLVGERCIGVLAMVSLGPLRSPTLTALEAVADSMAVGVEQAHMAESLAALLETERAARRALDRENRLVEALDAVGRAVIARLDLEEIVQDVTDAATRLTGAAFGAFFYTAIDERGEAFQLHTLSGAPRSAFERFPHPRNTDVFAPTFAGAGVVRLDDVTQDPRYGRNPPYRGMPEGHLPVRSYLAVPVVSAGGAVMGGLFFGHPEPARFGAEEERVAVGIARYAAIAMDNARLYEEAQRQLRSRQAMLEERERVSRALQRPLTPPAVPEIPGLDVAAVYRPFGDALAVGGDFYDIFEVPRGRWAFVVGDVSGKGPDAAAVTGLARPTLWAAGRAWGDPSEMLELLNGAIVRADIDRFCTAAVALVDPARPGARVRVALGGHPLPLLVRHDGRTSRVGTTGMILGVFPDAAFPSVPVVLHEGDALVLYTDGLTEGGGKHTFDDAQLLTFLGGLAGRRAADIADELAVEARTRREEFRDDLAILVVRVRG